MFAVSPVSRLSMPMTVVVAIEQGFGEVRADEAGRSGDDNAFFHSIGNWSSGHLVID